MAFLFLLNETAKHVLPIMHQMKTHHHHYHHHHHTNIISVVQWTASRTLNKVKTARRERNSVAVKTGTSKEIRF